MDSTNYSLNSKGIKPAAMLMINENAANLIEYIYKKANIIRDEVDKETTDKAAKAAKADKDHQETSNKEIAEEPVKVEKEGHKREEKPKAKKPICIFENPEVRIGLSIRVLAKTDRFDDERLINLILDDIEHLRRNTDYLLSFKDPKARKAALDEEYALVQGYIDMDDTISLNQETDTQSRVGKFASEGNCVIV